MSSPNFFLYSPDVGNKNELPEDEEQSHQGRKGYVIQKIDNK